MILPEMNARAMNAPTRHYVARRYMPSDFIQGVSE